MYRLKKSKLFLSKDKKSFYDEHEDCVNYFSLISRYLPIWFNFKKNIEK
jgi:hypothetical protein